MSAPSLATCPWCARAVPAAALACPSCGAPAGASTHADEAGWVSLPGARDMAELTVGTAGCQISGTTVPVADFRLAQNDTVYFSHHVLLWKDPTVQVRAQSLKGAWKRLFAGLPLVMTEAHGPGHIAFSKDHPGEMIAVPLNAGQAIDVREHVFVVATGSVTYDWFQTGIWFQTRQGDDTETHYPIGMFMDRFTAGPQPGLLMLHGAGNLFVRTLAAGETILLKPNALLYKSPEVSMHLVIEQVSTSTGGLFGWASPWQRYFWLRLRGPGRVAIQSADKHHHETVHQVVSASPSA